MATRDDRDEWMRRLGPLYPGAVAIRRTTAMGWGALRATPEDTVRSAPWMVAVGAVLGVGAWLAGWLVGRLGVVAALQGAVAIAALTALSAALLDLGLARSIERWLGRDRLEPGEIPALGPAGTIALMMAALLRVVAIISIRPSAWLAALVVAPLIGRWSALALQRLGELIEPPLGDRRSLVVGEVDWGTLGIVTVLVSILAVLGLGWASLLVLLAAGAVAFAIGLAVEKQRGGLDADTLAAVAALCELLALLGAAAIAPAVLSAWAI